MTDLTIEQIEPGEYCQLVVTEQTGIGRRWHGVLRRVERGVEAGVVVVENEHGEQMEIHHKRKVVRRPAWHRGDLQKRPYEQQPSFNGEQTTADKSRPEAAIPEAWMGPGRTISIAGIPESVRVPGNYLDLNFDNDQAFKVTLTHPTMSFESVQIRIPVANPPVILHLSMVKEKVKQLLENHHTLVTAGVHPFDVLVESAALDFLGLLQVQVEGRG